MRSKGINIALRLTMRNVPFTSYVGVTV
jgi:hypothetical protein